MASLGNVWTSLDTRKKLIAVLAAVAVFASILFLTRSVNEREMALLYSGLEGRSSGDVIAALDQRGVSYDVRGQAIYVPLADRDSLRMSLAGEGLPANSSQGYELLDSLSGFGTTSQMFDAAYWRAKEGELARTIVANPNIRTARVHISSPTNRPFQRENRATAAVTVTTAGNQLDARQARALRYLVASSVSGMTPADVAVIDDAGGLIDGTETPGSDTGAAELRARAERLLEARVGYGNAIVEVSVDTVNETELIRERRIDPESRVAISTETEERENLSQDTQPGDVTVASNLPDGDAEGGAGRSSSENTETRSLTNYEVSETNREVTRGPGSVRRLTVAVLVNQPLQTGPDGTLVPTPRSPEELAALGDLVSSAVGLDEDRGDRLTVQSMAFEPTMAIGTEAVAPGGTPLDMMRLVQLGTLAAVALILGLFVVRPILTQRAGAGGAGLPALSGPTAADEPDFNFGAMPMMGNALDFDGSAPAADADPVARLRNLIAERQDETIQILQSWVEDSEETERA